MNLRAESVTKNGGYRRSGRHPYTSKAFSLCITLCNEVSSIDILLSPCHEKTPKVFPIFSPIFTSEPNFEYWGKNWEKNWGIVTSKVPIFPT